MLNQEELQRKSEQLKEQKIKQIKESNISLDYSFDGSTIETNKSLKNKIKEYYNTENEYLISELDVSCVTSMYYLFDRCCKMNINLDNWDTSNVV